MVSDKEMLDRIAKLSSAIEQRKRGGGYSGRGRGAPNVAGYHQAYRPPPNRTLNPTPPLSQHRTLHNNKTGNKSPISQHRTLTNNSKPPVLGQYRPVNNIASQHRTLNNTATSSKPAAPVIKPTAPVISQHRTLVNNATTPPMNTFITKSIPSKPVPTVSHNRTLILNSKGPHQIVDGKKKVSIDGVEFIVKGKKLIRQDLLDKSAPIQSTAPKVLIRRSIKRHKTHNLTTAPNKISKVSPAVKYKKGNLVYYPHQKGYVRTGRSGNSITLKPPTKLKYCGFFTRYGKCPKHKMGRCPFKHDRERRAICVRFLSGKCKRSAAECRLSHSPNPHILPHCTHFQKGNCNNPTCPYAHVGVNPDATVCRAFAMEGYCPKGQSCHQKHVHLCPEFAETSKCSNINCRLPHVARKTSDTKTTGIVSLGSWVSPKYFYEQKMAMKERLKAASSKTTSSKVWSRPQTPPPMTETSEKTEKEEKPIDREQEEEQGFVRLFDDSDDDEGWSQFEREDTVDNAQSLRFNDDDDEEEEEEGEDEGEDEQMEDEEMDEKSDDEEGEFYDAEEDVKDVIVLSDDDSDMEVYEEVSDDEITEEDLS